MDGFDTLREWNRLFVSLSLRLGRIYYQTGDMEFSLSKIKDEHRWRWVDERFIEDASKVYIWLLSHPKEQNSVLECNLEDLITHVINTPESPLPNRAIDSSYLRLYMDDEYNKSFY
mgnify:CR=1 FL=1